MKPAGESQRIYWQQWLPSSSSKGGSGYFNRRELITSSAAIRINPEAAKASDVTTLLRDTLKLSSLDEHVDDQSNNRQDSLVLVGTLYSLPKDYIQFEHEPPKESSDPFHVIKTLKPNDNPLALRDEMMDHLTRIQQEPAQNPSNSVKPKVQWYFVPKGRDESPIPSCIELDGYCTSMEEEDFSQEDDEADDAEPDENDECDKALNSYYDIDLLLSRCPLAKREASSPPSSPSRYCQTRHQKEKEMRRYFQLCQVPPSCCGYLMKQSSCDPHAWRRVYCTLTDDHLWYTTRVPYKRVLAAKTDPLRRMGKYHGRISLGRALLVEPNTEYPSSPLFRVPFSFEVVNARGVSHVFRAPSRVLQQQWVSALSTKIMESFENSLIDQAEMVVAEETMARNRRMNSVAVDPLCESSSTFQTSMYLSLIQMSVLRLGIEIAEYKEFCRQMQASVSSVKPVMARSENGGSTANENQQQSRPSSKSSNGDIQHTELTWERAAKLVDRCTNVALEVQRYTHHQTQKQQQVSLSHSLETHCRHIEYVFTGRHRTSGGQGINGERTDHEAPPPTDLFDLLLSELQHLVQTPKV